MIFILAVGGNHAFHSAAYLSEPLIQAVHTTLRAHSSKGEGEEGGVPLQDFPAKFKASKTKSQVGIFWLASILASSSSTRQANISMKWYISLMRLITPE